MLIVKGIYEENEIRLLEPVKVAGKHIVEVRFIEEEFAKKKQLDAFRRARGIWKDRTDVDTIFKGIEERWSRWRKNLEEFV